MFKMTRFQALAASTALLTVPQLAAAEIRDFDLSGFSRVEISTGINAIVEIGGEFSVRAESDDPKIMDDLKIEVRGRKLTAELDLGFFANLMGKNNDVTVFITLPKLTEVESNSGADVIVSGSFGDTLIGDASSGASLILDGVIADTIDLDASSGASLRVSGECSILHADASSGASIKAEGLTCLDVTTDASSGASTNVFATRSIEADASSGGGVNIMGGPDQIDVDESSGGDVKFRN